MGIEQLISQLGPESLAILTSLLNSPDADKIIQQLLEIAQEFGPQAVDQALQQFAQEQGLSPQGGAPGDPSVQPGGDPLAQGPVTHPGMAQDPLAQGPPSHPGQMDASLASPPGMPPDPSMGGMMPQAPLPMPGGTPAGVPGAPPPGGSVQPGMIAEKPKVKTKKVPKYSPPKVPKVSKPTLDDIIEDARAGREYWQPRDIRIREDYDLYHLTYGSETFGDREATVVGGTIVHRRSQPNTLVNLVTGLATARNDKLKIEIEPRADDEQHKTAAQEAEDFVTYSRECDEDAWLEDKVGEMPLPRKEAGLAALEGGIGWTWDIDADDEEYPFRYMLVPLSQLYDVGHACTRQYTLPVHQARREYEAVKAAYPAGSSYDPNQMVRIIVHIDNYGVWKSIIWETVVGSKRGFGGTRPPSDEYEANRWIMKPKRMNFGFRGFNYVVWGGTPAEILQGQERTNIGYKGYGVLTMLRRTFKLMDVFISAVATGALSAVDPATVVYTDEPDHLKVKKPDRRPNAHNVFGKDDKIEPLVWEISRNADAQNLMNSLISELADVQSPALNGAAGPSGIAQQISTEQASQQTVGPIIDALEKWYGMMHRQRLILALRYSTDDKYNVDDEGESQTYFSKYAKRSYRGDTSGQYGELKPKDIEDSGVRVLVRYHDRNVQEDAALAQMVTQLTGAHLMSQESALRKLGVKNPQREIQAIFADGASMEPTVLKALVETAVYNSGNPELIAAWDKAFYAEMVKGQGPAQAAPPGVGSLASPANQPGMNMQGTSSAVQAPGAQQMGLAQ